MIRPHRYLGVVTTTKKHGSPEHDLQCACVHWYRLQYPQYSSLLFAVPNGGARNLLVATRLKAEGVTAGVADLILLVPQKKPVFLELKTRTGRQSDGQKEWQKSVVEAGYQYTIIRSIEEFVTVVNDAMGRGAIF